MENDIYSEAANKIKERLEITKEDNQKVIEFSKNYLVSAKDDLEASRILYERGKNALAIYHLQQAVEKASKSLALVFFSVSPNKIREINHKSPMSFVEIIKGNLWMVNLAKTKNPDIKSDTEPLEKLINTQGREIAKWKKEEIIVLLDLTEKSLESLSNIESQLKFLDVSPDVNAKFFIGVVKGMLRLYTNSCITYPHWMSTRYPDQDLKPEDYKGGLGIFDCYERLLNSTDDSIKSLEAYINCLQSTDLLSILQNIIPDDFSETKEGGK